MVAPRKYPNELRERAVRLVLDAKKDKPSRVLCRILVMRDGEIRRSMTPRPRLGRCGWCVSTWRTTDR